MKNFLIIARDDDKVITDFVKKISAYINNCGGSSAVKTNPVSDGKEYNLIDVPEDAECIISIGGDGTLIRTAQNTAGCGLPMIGINLGHMGYLCDVDESNWQESIDKLIAGDFRKEERMMLEGCIGGESEAYHSLNDIVISSTALGHSVINLSVNVNGSDLLAYDCDGMVFATPTGSTAYNMSAGGPICNPNSSMIVLTPLNAHTLNSRSVILDANDEITVTLVPRRNDNSESAVVGFDGNHRVVIKAGQSVKIKKSSDTTAMITVAGTNFLERMRLRMQ